MLLVGASLLVGIAVLAYGLFIAKGHAYTVDETRVLAQLAASRLPALVDVSLAINWLFSPPIALIIGAIAAVVVYVSTRRWRATIHFITLVLVSWLSSEVVKVLVHRPRPVARVAETLVPNPDPDSYPSGHECFAVGLGFAIVLLIANRRAKVIVAIIATLLAVVTAFSRVYLGIHYPTDAIASLVLAAAALVAIETLWRRYLSGRRIFT